MTAPSSRAAVGETDPAAARAVVVGLDLSLTSTGIAIADDNGGRTRTIRTAKLTDTRRLRTIVDDVILTCFEEQPALVVIEGPSYGSTGGMQHERGGLWWMVAEALDDRGYARAVMTPTALKKYATGSGSASKDAVLIATCRRFPGFDGDNNAADALWLAAAGADHLGCPLVHMPAVNRSALAKVQWPTAVTA